MGIKLVMQIHVLVKFALSIQSLLAAVQGVMAQGTEKRIGQLIVVCQKILA